MNTAAGSESRAAGTFDAFISYGHAADGRLAPALQTGLERLASPWYRRRVLRVFRDDVGLSVNPDLWGSIRDALDRSEWFVLLLSPEAAASPWVNEEISHWLSAKPVERILLVQTDGVVAWDGERRDFDPERSSCIPPALLGRMRAEPRHLDLTWAHGEDHLDLRHVRFRDALADLAAPIHGVPKDEIESEDVRQYRRSVRARRAAFAALASLLAVAVLTSAVALTQRNRAQHQTAIAVSQRLAIQAASIAPRKLDLALLLAVAGHRLDDSAQTSQGLLAALAESPQLREFDHRLGTELGTMALSPNRRTLVVVDLKGTVRMVDSRTSRPRVPAVVAPVGVALETAFSRDGRWLAIGGDKGTQIYDARSLHAVGGLLHDDGAIEWLAFSPDGTRLATSSSTGWVRVRSTVDWKPIAPPLRISPSRATSIAFSPDGARLLVGTHEGTVAVIGASSLERAGPPLRVAKRGEAYAVAFSPDGATLATGGEDGTVTLWRAENLTRRGHRLVLHHSAVYAAAFSPNSQLLATSDDTGEIGIWRVSDGTRVTVLRGHAGLVFDLAFTGNQRLISAAGGEIARWDLDAVLLGSRVGEEPRGARVAAFSPDGSELIAGRSNDGRLFRLRLSGSSALAPLQTSVVGRVEALAWSLDGRRIFVAGEPRTGVDAAGEGHLVAYSADGGHALQTASIGAGIQSLAVSRDGTRVAVGDGGGRVTLWDARTLTRVAPILRPGRRITAVAFSPDGRTIATGNGFAQVTLWRVDDGAKVWQYVADSITRALVWSPDGSFVLAAGLRVDRLTAATGRPAGSAVVPGVGEARALAVTTDGSTAVVAGLTGKLSIIDLASADVRYVLPGHTGRANAVAFIRSGTTLMSAGEDGLVIEQAIDPDHWEMRACKAAGRTLTLDEIRSYDVKEADVCRDANG